MAKTLSSSSQSWLCAHVCVQISPFCKNISDTDSGAHPTPLWPPLNELFSDYFLMFIFEVAQVGEGEGEEDRGSEAGSVLTAESPRWGSDPWAATSWPELKSDAQLTEPLRSPLAIISKWGHILANCGFRTSTCEFWEIKFDLYQYPILEYYGRVIKFTVASTQQKSTCLISKLWPACLFVLLPKSVDKLVFVKLITANTRGVTHLIASCCWCLPNTETIYFVSGCLCVCVYARLCSGGQGKTERLRFCAFKVFPFREREKEKEKTLHKKTIFKHSRKGLCVHIRMSMNARTV